MKKIITAALVAALTAMAVGTAVADDDDDDTPRRNAPAAPVVALLNIGEIDDPMEDVLEHALQFGNG
ncbi:hypothetical protein ACFWP3_01540 [Streptomyces sp. NPDC058525]|uniref:hypothetical protein n=1 Tax=unclassified Streptomyces TaxID=2593676 RepID=UPI0036657C12